MERMKIRELILSSFFIALITIGTFIKIPVGTDVYTLQFLFTLLAGLILGAKLGALTVGVYVLMGLIGIPVFAAGGGLGYIIQPTFGYLVGFILQAWFCGKYARKLNTISFKSIFAVNLGGMLIVYLFGISYFYIASNYLINAPIAIWPVIFYCGILQVIPDILLCIAATGLALRCYHANLWLDSNLIINEELEMRN